MASATHPGIGKRGILSLGFWLVTGDCYERHENRVDFKKRAHRDVRSRSGCFCGPLAP